MTNEQAIEVINGHINDSSIAYGTFTGQALRMAIEALKAQLSQEETTKDTTSDTISRRAAIDAIHKNYDTILDFKSDGRTVADSFEDIINTLPPAQPVLTCKGCKYDYYEYAGCRNCLRRERDLYEPE